MIAILPIGGYKGYGLALVFGLLAGTLNGAAMRRDMVDFNADDTTPTNTGHSWRSTCKRSRRSRISERARLSVTCVVHSACRAGPKSG